jgi:peptide/nickel transport system permease protein
MISYIGRRLVQSVVVLLAMSFVIYGLIWLMPGDPLDIMTSANPSASPEAVAQLRKIWGVDQPFMSRYWHWLTAALSGDLGFSRMHSQPVLDVLVPALLQTCKLMIPSFLISAILSLAFGVAAAMRPGAWLDSVISLTAFVGISIPVFWLALMLVMVGAVQLHWFPASGIGDGFVDQLNHLVMPTTTLVLATTGGFTRYVRASMIEAMRAEHVQTARAKGARELRVVLIHALRVALIPVVTIMALGFGALFNGALLTETIFAQPGMGKMIYDAINNSDFNLALTGLLFATLMTLLSNLMADLACAWLDPRIRLQ